MLADRDPVLVDLRRSPVGRAHKGSLASIRPDDLAAGVLSSLLADHPHMVDEIDDVVCGCAFPWGEQGYNVGRSIALLARLPFRTPAQTITRLCASSLQATRSAAHAIQVGEADTCVVVGVESISRVGRGLELAEPNPLLDPGSQVEPIASVFMPMGLTAELVADRYAVSRDEMDRFALGSHQRAVSASDCGFSAREIVPIELGDGAVLDHDESPRPTTDLQALGRLSPIFREGGTVTAGNSCPLNDGAAAGLMTSAARARDLALTPRARIVSSAVSAVDPSLMGIGPIEAIQCALRRAGLTIEDLDIVEINEAFAAQVIPVCREVGIDPFDGRVNPYGGAIAIGHPFGMTGLRMVTTLVNGLDDVDGEFGIAAMCVGGGQGQAMIVQRLAG